ncbi:unnamed protein product [Brachionus calyciflorus]|uniref:Uncharacterized protein n=1 Tax=Brachionus calyciflorus TaxID=104777 RepID=A0A813YV83_9BILA|nr:unnamed protein product [Brachionus calyciflorus]
MRFKLTKPSESYHTDSGWGWIVCLTSGYCFGILIGMLNNYALIYVEFEHIYNQTENHVTYVGWIGSMSIGVQYIFCVLGSILVDLYNPLKIGLLGSIISTLSLISCIFVTKLQLYFLTYGFLFGLGQAFLLASTLSILPYYFKKKLSLANGIMNFIGSIIIVLLPILTSIIIDKYNIKITFVFLAGLSSMSIPAVLTYKTPEKTRNELHSLKQQIRISLGTEIFKHKKFLIWCLSNFVGKFGYYIPIINIDHYAKLAFPDKQPFVINVVFSICAAISGILFGKLGDLTVKKIAQVHYHTLVYLVYGIVQIFIPFAKDYWAFMLEIVLLGIIDGILLSFIVPIAFSLAGCSRLANQAAAYYHITMSITSILGPTIAGRIFEVYKSYDFAFYLGGLSCLIAGLILLVGTKIVDCLKNKQVLSEARNENTVDEKI